MCLLGKAEESDDSEPEKEEKSKKKKGKGKKKKVEKMTQKTFEPFKAMLQHFISVREIKHSWF